MYTKIKKKGGTKMKKTVILMLFVVFGLTSVGLCQNYDVLYVNDFSVQRYCSSNDNLDGVIIYGEDDCDNHSWYVTIWNGYDEIVFLEDENIDSIIVYNQHMYLEYLIYYNGCYNNYENAVVFEVTYTDENPFLEPTIWKHKNSQLELNAVHNTSSAVAFLWSTGETTQTIEVVEPGTYFVTLTDDCGSATYSVEVRDNVEIYRVTTDLVTNKNQVTWRTTPEQSEYISAVKVYRNNELVGTVPYADGVFTDNIGSENTQWQYYIVGVSVEGDDCPIPSYWKRTIHLDRIQDSQGNLILQWTPYEEESPEKDVVSAYGIYDVVNGIPNHVIDVGNFTNVYTYNPADFHGYGAVAAVFAEKGLEEFAFSNLTKQMLDIDENITEIPVMKIYPNPSNGAFTVECVSDLIVYNVIGQVIATSHATENGIHNFSLGTGIYFVKSDEGAVQKIIVE